MPEERIVVTEEEFNRYVDIQKGGRFNMLDPRALEATGLTHAVYREILLDYTALVKKYPDVNGIH